MKKNAYWIIITILELAALISSIVLSTYIAFVFNFTTDILLQIGDWGNTSLCKIGICILLSGLANQGNWAFARHFQGKTHSGNTGAND